MDKKGMAIMTTVGMAIALIFLVVFLVSIFSPESLAPTVAKASEGIGDDILLGLGKEKFEKGTFEADPVVFETFNDIVELLRTEGQGPCILRRKPFADDFKDFEIILEETSEGISAQVFRVLGRQRQVMDGSTTIVGKKPCFVGEGGSAEKFFDNYLDGSNCLDGSTKCWMDDSSQGSILIKNKEKITVGSGERDLKDENLVFMNKDGNVCFIPTKEDTDFGEDCDKNTIGLDDDCMDENKNDGLWVNIPMCGEELDGVFLCDEEFCEYKIPPESWRKTTDDIPDICDSEPSPEDSEPDGNEICGQIGSIRIIGDYDVQLYENKNYGGKRICFRDEGWYRLDDYDITCGFFGCNGWNQDTDSVQILPNGACTNPGVTV